MQSSRPDGKVIFEPAFVGLALHLGNQVMVAEEGEACFLQIWGFLQIVLSISTTEQSMRKRVP